MAARPNILFLTHRVPHPPNRGDRIRSWNMLRFLADRADIHLACLSDEPTSAESRRELDRICQRVKIQPLSGAGRWIQGIRSLMTGGSATAGLFRSKPLNATVREWAKETQFDAVLVFCSSMFQFARCPELTDVPLIVDLVDVDSEKWLNYADTSSFLKGQLYRLEARRVRNLEVAIAERAKAVTLVSEDEVQVFHSFCSANNVHAVGNGVDLDYFHPAPPEYRAGQDEKTFKLVFVGVLDYRANIEGLRWFVREVWPQLREQIPEVELDLVGRRPGDAVRELAKTPGMNLIGEVDDVRPYVWQADVVIAPLTIARGIQNKVLEAMAMAKPIIATPEALVGLPIIPDLHAVRASECSEWVVSICRLLGSDTRRELIGVTARQQVVAHHQWNISLKKFAELLEIDTETDSGIVAAHRFQESPHGQVCSKAIGAAKTPMKNGSR